MARSATRLRAATVKAEAWTASGGHPLVSRLDAYPAVLLQGAATPAEAGALASRVLEARGQRAVTLVWMLQPSLSGGRPRSYPPWRGREHAPVLP